MFTSLVQGEVTKIVSYNILMQRIKWLITSLVLGKADEIAVAVIGKTCGDSVHVHN